MLGVLNENQINYVLYHLNFNFKVTKEIRECFVFTGSDSDQPVSSGKIIFRLAIEDLQDDRIRKIGEIPVLFPLGNKPGFFHWENDSLIFHHDLLKSSFLLLSGYQEYREGPRDKFGRFPFEGSLQQRLGIVAKPVVNYYFKHIEEGIRLFCEKKRISFEQNRLFDKVGFMLTHDVDIIDTYTFHDLIFKLKQVLGLAPRDTLKKSIHYFWKYMVNYLNILSRPNPHWDFEYLVSTAKKFDYRSVFYFLHKDLRHKDSYYRFQDRRIRELFKYLTLEGCEIGLHGSTRSANNLEVLKEHNKKLCQYSGQTIRGIRQHRLIHFHAKTAQLQVEAKLLYDASLGFAEHEGFRNSFCYPFRLYDFQNDRMVDIWQVPLIVMDATLYMYRKMDPEQSITSVRTLVNECKRFNGIFSLLWHNGNFDSENYPEGKQLFENILDYLKESDCVSVTGSACINNNVMPIFEKN